MSRPKLDLRERVHDYLERAKQGTSEEYPLTLNKVGKAVGCAPSTLTNHGYLDEIKAAAVEQSKNGRNQTVVAKKKETVDQSQTIESLQKNVRELSLKITIILSAAYEQGLDMEPLVLPLFDEQDGGEQ